MSDRDADTPRKSFLYQSVRADIIAMIQARGMQPHEMLPSESAIADTYHVSRMTGKLALKSLEDDGIIYRVKRRGSFLAEGFEARIAVAEEAKPTQERPPKQFSIALIVPPFDFYVGEIIRSIQKAAEDRSVRLVLHMTDGDEAEEARVLRELSRLTYINGIILYPLSRADIGGELISMKLNNYPLVLVDRTFEGMVLDSVVHGHYEGAHEITSYLINRGHENIGFVSQPLGTSRSRELRYQGYIHALMEHGAPILKNHIRIIESDIHTVHGKHVLDSPAHAVLCDYLASNRQLTAVVCDEDYTLLEVFYAARNVGLRVPEDLSMTGFTDNRVLRFAPMRFSTVRQPVDELGEKAVELLLQRIANPDRSYSKVTIDTEIVDRESIRVLSE